MRTLANNVETIPREVARQVTAYRVEGHSNARVLLSPKGEVAIVGRDKMLIMNIGQEQRAQSYLALKLRAGLPGAQIKSFEVPESFLDRMRTLAVPERMKRLMSDRPLLVDITKASDQFGLRAKHIDELAEGAIPGTGRVE